MLASAALALGLAAAAVGDAAVSAVVLRPISTDPFTGGGAQHQTEVEPDVATNGSTVVSAFQIARYKAGGGAQATGWATSTNGGSSWSHGTLPSLTTSSSPPGPYDRVVDNSVDYDTTHGVWLISSIGIQQRGTGFRNAAAVVSRSSNGTSWGAPVVVDSSSQPDKDWLRCDNWPSSPHKGTCYLAYSYLDRRVLAAVSHSTDGGATWSPSTSAPNSQAAYNLQLAIQPNGNVVVVGTRGGNSGSLIAFGSTDGGATWSTPVVVGAFQMHAVGGGTAVEGVKPSVRVDGQGTVYAVWTDCRFRPSCSANDLVMSTSPDGATWSAVQRIPIDAVTSPAEHFLPGLGVDPATGGSSAHLGLVYYFYAHASCPEPCSELRAGFIESANGGSSWRGATTITPPMSTGWLAVEGNARMLGDYFCTVFVHGRPLTVVAFATRPATDGLREGMYAALPSSSAARMTATLAANGSVSVAPRSGPAGQYAITVRDRSRLKGFHLKGPGVNRSTSRRFTGTVTWRVTLNTGTYVYSTDGPRPRRGTIHIQ